MWKKGRMTEDVKKTALKMIEEDKLSDRWDDEKIRKERAKKIDKIKVKLESPMPCKEKNKLMIVNQKITYDGNEMAKVYKELN